MKIMNGPIFATFLPSSLPTDVLHRKRVIPYLLAVSSPVLQVDCGLVGWLDGSLAGRGTRLIILIKMVY